MKTPLTLVDETYPDGPPNDMEQFISEYVERARRGTLKTVAVAVVNDDGSIGTAWFCTGKSSLLGSAAISALSRRFHRMVDSDDSDY